jgi:mRNA-degrading endonuclease YafQ of YafQ-DinJ toxin-antitoxin module
MKRIILSAPAFERRLVRFIKLHRDIKDEILRVIRILASNVDHPSLKTHKLHGRLGKSYACSINYDYRIVFSFNEKFIYLKSIGNHDDVY